MECLGCGLTLKNPRAKTCSARCRVSVSRRRAAHEQHAKDVAALIDNIGQDCANALITDEYAYALIDHIQRALDAATRNVKRRSYARSMARDLIDTKERQVLQE